MSTSTESRGFPILTDLPAAGPHPDLGDQAEVFGWLVGTWAMDVELFDDEGGTTYHQPGVWAFDWVLDGRAIQDVLTGPSRTHPADVAPGVRGIGTSIRVWRPVTGQWDVVFLGASTGFTVVLHGGRDGDDIVLFSDPESDGTLNRWRFSEIRSDSFLWTGHESPDGGRTWPLLRQRMTGTRIAPGQ